MSAERCGRTPRSYRLLEVVGLELEYAIVDRELQPRCWAESLIARLAGRPASSAEIGAVGVSNELAAHVLEIKAVRPNRSLARAERQLVAGVRRVASIVDRELGGLLLPTGMHPLMRPSQTRLWTRTGRSIYQTYARLFSIYQHGWLNVQSSQVNLPFGDRTRTATLYNAIACLLPYLPALAASSPLVEGGFGPAVDNRLVYYGRNQARVPEITGAVVPEYIESLGQFRREVLGSVYDALDRVDGARPIRHEWVNSRGAIPRFDRDAIEIRVLDLQECVRMDVAIAALVRGATAWMMAELESGQRSLPPHATLVSDYRRVVRAGLDAQVAAVHLGRRGRAAGPVTARSVLERLVEHADAVASVERPYLVLADRIVHAGNLSERIRRGVGTVRGHGRRRERILGVYRELAACLLANEPWALA